MKGLEEKEEDESNIDEAETEVVTVKHNSTWQALSHQSLLLMQIKQERVFDVSERRPHMPSPRADACVKALPSSHP